MAEFHPRWHPDDYADGVRVQTRIGDLISAATELEHARMLMTRNVRHFSRIPGLGILKPANATCYSPS